MQPWRTGDAQGRGLADGGKALPTCFVVEVLEELLVVDAGHTADLGDLHLGPAVAVDEVGGDADRQLPTHLLPLEPWGQTQTPCPSGLLGPFLAPRKGGIGSAGKSLWGVEAEKRGAGRIRLARVRTYPQGHSVLVCYSAAPRTTQPEIQGAASGASASGGRSRV